MYPAHISPTKLATPSRSRIFRRNANTCGFKHALEGLSAVTELCVCVTLVIRGQARRFSRRVAPTKPRIARGVPEVRVSACPSGSLRRRLGKRTLAILIAAVYVQRRRSETARPRQSKRPANFRSLLKPVISLSHFVDLSGESQTFLANKGEKGRM